MVASLQATLKCVACVAEAKGFRAAMHRLALSGMLLLFRKRTVPVAVFPSVDPAVTWMKANIAMGGADAFIAAVAEARAQLSR
jgi:hypothetical protein